MDLMRELRYKRDDLNEKLKEAPWWVWVVIGVVLVGLLLLPVTCRGGGGDRGATRDERDAMLAKSHLRQAYQEVMMRLADPEQKPDLAAAAEAVMQQRPDAFTCPETGKTYRLNPDVRLWLVTIPQRLPVGMKPPMDSVLIVTDAPETEVTAGVAFYGIRPGAMPVNLAAGEAPAWLSDALVPGG